jgi:hypothetical protein
MHTTLERSPMSTVTLRDAPDDLERRLAGDGAPMPGPARSGGWLRAEEEDDEDDLYGEDDLGFDDIDEDDEDEVDELDADLDEDDLEELDEDADDEA